MLYPTNDWIWIELDEGQISGTTTTAAGLHITADIKSISGLVTGTVINAGPGRYSDSGNLIPMRIRISDKVMFTKSIALQNKIEHEGKSYILIREENIMAVVERA